MWDLYNDQKRFKAKMASRYHYRGQVIQEVLEDERGLPRDVGRLVCIFAAVPEGQMPGKPQYNAYKIDRACWGALKRMYRYLCPEKEKRQ